MKDYTPKHNDYITVIKTTQSHNKHTTLDANGRLIKAPANPLSEGIAQTVEVKTQGEFIKMLKAIHKDPHLVMVLGFIPETVWLKQYPLLSKDKLNSYTAQEKAYTRTKDNFVYSSWFLMDHDQDDQTPGKLKFKTFAEVDKALLDMCPGIDGYIRTASNSSRIEVDGSPVYSGTNCHYFIQAKDSSDIQRFGKALLIDATVNTGYGFTKERHSKATGDVVGKQAWSVFDPSTYSPERIVFEGKPTVKNLGGENPDKTIAVIDSLVHVAQGKRLDTTSIKSPDKPAIKKFRKKSGITYKTGNNGSGGGYFLNHIELDAVIDTIDHGSMTIRDYCKSTHKKLRAQSPFRDSDSQAAYINRHADGVPFVWDAGIKYMLKGNDKQEALAMINKVNNSNGNQLYPAPAGYIYDKTGVYKLDNNGDNTQLARGPVAVKAISRDKDNNNWGILIAWYDLRGKTHEEVFPRRLLHEGGNELALQLVDKGLDLFRGQEKELTEYLSKFTPVDRLVSVPCTGWHEGSFVLPNEIIHEPAGEKLIYKPTAYAELTRIIDKKGSHEDWQAGIEDISDMGIFVVCAALTAPVNVLVNGENGGFHLYGETSRGKTTLLQLASSVWGNGADPGRSGGSGVYLQRWNTTSNALEARAETHNDLPMVIDEIGEGDSKEFGSLIYKIISGTGKSRSDRKGDLKAGKSWRTSLISAGEIAVSDFIESGGQTVKGGQLVRMIDIDLSAAPALFNTADEADTMKEHCAFHYGHAGPLLVQQCPELADGWNTFDQEQIGTAITPIGKRVRAKFALATYVGIKAAQAGITPWSEDRILSAVSSAYQVWQRQSNAVSDAERGIEALKDFTLTNEARFEIVGLEERPTANRAGWYRNGTFHFTPKAFKTACSGIDPVQVKRALKERGLLVTNRATGLTNNLKVKGSLISVVSVKEGICQI